MIVRKFPRNTAGRDFIVGDIHGCFDAVRAAMADAEFNEAQDRLFSVGDLVDRGPSSEEAVDWIAQPWFHAVRGNHEQMAIGVAGGRHDLHTYAMNGGRWFIALDDYRQQLTAQAFETLPVAIEIDHTEGRIGLVHAEVYGDSWDDFTAALAGDLSKSKHRNLLEYALWSRSRWQAHRSGYSTAPIKDLRALFVGHTPVEDVLTLANVVYVDTGAVFKGGRLTLAEISSLVPANDGEGREAA
jgi:Calcineurin-like phosphoesterase.